MQEAKKEFAKTKQESEILKEYRDKELDALKVLRKGNFDDEENLKERIILDKSQEKDKETLISQHILAYLANQKARLTLEKDDWEKRKNDKQSAFEKKNLQLENSLIEKHNENKKLTEEYGN